MDRLALATLDRVPAAHRPRVDPGSLGIGIVHLGIGAFHRAHQAAFTEDAIAASGGGWGISGVSQRSRSVVDTLGPQDGLYTLLTRSGDDVDAHVVGTVREVLFAGTDSAQVAARFADPAVRVITLTVTEKGYRDDAAVIGRLVAGLQARMRADAGPVAVLSCDNLAHNGRTLGTLVREFAARLPGAEAEPFRDWIDAQVRFPSSMVDRIVPAPTERDRLDAQRLIGLRDSGTVATETFRQWVIEDDFPGGRPAWEQAGAVLTDDVTPYETIKLRMLNAAHSMLAYLGALAGCETIADAVARFAPVVAGLWDEVRPTLHVPAGFDLPGYERQLLARFAEPALRHGTLQVAMDGSQKLPQRLLTTIRDARARGTAPRRAALAVAAWMRWVQVAPTLDDPLADELHAAVAAVTNPAQVVDRLLGVRAVFGADLADDPTVRDLLVDSLRQLSRDDAPATLERGIA